MPQRTASRRAETREADCIRLVIFSPSALHPRAVAVSVVGRSPGSRLDAFSRPSRCQCNTSGLRVLAAYSCGGSRGIGMNPHRVPFLVPPNAGTDDGVTITGKMCAARTVVGQDCAWTVVWLGSQMSGAS
jgi:hypothetical protein